MKNFFKALLPKYLTNIIVRVALKLSGPLGWIASIFVNKYTKKICIEIYYWLREGKDTIVAWWVTKKYDKIVKDKDATREERRSAEDDFING